MKKDLSKITKTLYVPDTSKLHLTLAGTERPATPEPQSSLIASFQLKCRKTNSTQINNRW